MASGQGASTTGANVNIGITGATLPTGTGNSFGNGGAAGTSNGFATSQLGAATATGTGGGNSTAATQFTLLDNAAGPTGTGLSSSVGAGSGQAGGNGVFGPSLAAAVAAATAAPSAPAPAAVVVVETDKKKKSKDGGDVVVVAIPEAPQAPPFSFVQGLPTGGGGGGNGVGSGTTSVGIVNAAGQTTDEAYGTNLANGFGFGVGSGVAVNNAGEQAGGQGGGTALGQGNVVFEVDEAFGASFANNGLTTSAGGGGAYVGFDPPAAQIFGAFITPPPSATP